MCGIETSKRGRKTLILDHASKPGEKIRISGGGRCNFTNIHTTPKNFLSKNNRFCISALNRYTQQDFIKFVERYGIAYHEKTLGQLFCDDSSKQIVNMLVDECTILGGKIQLETSVKSVTKTEDGFIVHTSAGDYTTSSLVVATGGLSIPKMGATDLGYRIAKQFDLKMIPTRAALVPLTFDEKILNWTKDLAGISVDASVKHGKTSFREGIVFTHKGISGPAILQISSYWKEGDDISINLSPDILVEEYLRKHKEQSPKQMVHNVLSLLLPKRLIQQICEEHDIHCTMAELSNKHIHTLSTAINHWKVTPKGSEGYKTAEVTLGGVDTDELSSKTLESTKVSGLYFIGEVVDVTGHLGGFNFQWAWASGFAAGQYA